MAAHGIQAYFSAEEVNRLQEGLPMLDKWSTRILVPFRAHRLRHASLVWLNRRWFNERHFDLDDDAILQRIRHWILGDFSYIASVSPAEVDPDDARTLHADRYGSSTGMAVHGGSGRVAVDRCFQAKGVGQTPLVSAESRPGHAHGSMSLTEAIREAIFAEVAAAEFPHEAVPIIAIIDTGLTFSSPDPADIYDQHTRRAIAIRPVAVRIAHAERAPLFKASATGFKNVQADDARRTREVIDAWMSNALCDGALSDEAAVLATLLHAIVEQIAFGQVHRLFCGGFFSSNLTISGGFLDFGNMHALPDWSHAQVHSVVEGFGSEMSLLDNIIHSLSFHIAKYRGLGTRTKLAHSFFDDLDQTYQRAWKTFSLALFHLGDAPADIKEAVHGLLLDYFATQQQTRTKYRFGEVVSVSGIRRGQWLYGGIIAEAAEGADSHEAPFMKRLDHLLREGLSKDERWVAWQTAARLLQPRDALDRRTLLKSLASLTSPARPAPSMTAIEAYISRVIDRGRRHWPRLPKGLGVLAHVTHGGSTALLTSSAQASMKRLWLEGIEGADHTYGFFDQRLSADEGRMLGVANAPPYWSCFVEVIEDNDRYVIDLPDRQLTVPPMTVTYRPPAPIWVS